MKKFIIPKTEKEILRTHPISSKTEGWFIRIEETSNNSFLVEAIDRYGRIVSKQGSNLTEMQAEVENELCALTALR
jgi:hypothetical protein